MASCKCCQLRSGLTFCLIQIHLNRIRVYDSTTALSCLAFIYRVGEAGDWALKQFTGRMLVFGFFFQPNSELRTWMFRDIKQYTYNMTLIKSVKSEWRILYALVQGPHGFVVSCDPSEEKSDPWGISEKTVPVCAFFFRKQHGVYLIYLWKCSKCQEWGCFLHLLHYMPQYLRESWTMVTNRKFWWIEPNLLKTFHYWWLDTEDGRKDFWIMFFKGEKKGWWWWGGF